MQRVDLPYGGVSLSRLVFGAMRLPDPQRPDPALIAGLIEAAVERGITTFDHADIYGEYAVEEAFGAGLRAWGGDRDAIELVSKCDIMLPVGSRPQHRLAHYDTSAAHIMSSVDRSLTNLGTGHLDLLLIHRPDPLLDADETAGALSRLVRTGKVRTIGVSNFLPHQIEMLASRLDVPIATNQVELSLSATTALYDGTLDHAQQHRYPPMIWSPLGGGALLTGDDERAQRVRGVLERLAAEYDATPGAIALAWTLRHPSRPVAVLGTMRAERLRELARADDIELDRQDWFELLEASHGHRVP